ncbi:cytochrome c biogenesis protein ResB [bacterium]|nr:cytochrome c biogenesis protein ResB [bacterium]
MLMVLIAVACIVGTLVKQEPYDANRAVAHYGKQLGLLVGLLGLNHLYHTWWFVALLSLFALSTVACALPRMKLRLRTLGSGIVHLSIVFIVAGVIAKGLMGVEGMVRIAEGHSVNAVAVEDGSVPLGFQVRLEDFEIQRYAGTTNVLHFQGEGDPAPRQEAVEVGRTFAAGADGTTVEVLRYVPHFVFRLEAKDVVSASDEPVNPALQVKVKTPSGESTRWLFAKFPDPHGQGHGEGGPRLLYEHRPGRVKAFASHVTVLDAAGTEVKQATVKVNEPLKYGRYTFYQASYDQKTERATVLEVVYDPGVPLVFGGFILMPLGMAYVFYAQPFFRRKARRNV